MKLFNTVALEISARCNRRCKFCPVAYNTRPDERMDLVLFMRALKQLQDLRYRGRIELYIYNEPLRDWVWALNCIEIARAWVPGATLMIATNGDYIKTTSRIVELFNAGLNQLLINCYSPGLYERRERLLQALPTNVRVADEMYRASGPRSRLVWMLDKSQPDAFGTGVFGLINRAGNIPDFKPPVVQPLTRMCVKPFRMLNINWCGHALVCCNDYHGEMAYGNLRESTLVELWNNPVMQTYRARLWNKVRGQPLCDVCDCHSGAYPGNVDHSDVETVPQAKLYELQGRNRPLRKSPE